MLGYFSKLVSNIFNRETGSIEVEPEEDEESIISKINAPETENYDDAFLPTMPKTLGQSEPEEIDVQVFQSVTKTGKITFLGPEYGIIDKTHYFDLNASLLEHNLKIDDCVQYTAYRARENESERIFRVLPVKNDCWSIEDEPLIEKEIGEPEEITALPRVINGRVTERNGRKILIEPMNIWCNLDDVNASYVPIEGDWVSIEASVAVCDTTPDLSGDILQITSLTPLVSKCGIGRVTFWSDAKSEGVIENFLYFTKVICEKGYVPNLGDQVLYDAIESDQDIYKWRALKVFPNVIISDLNNTDNTSLLNIVSPKNDIIIKPFNCNVELKLNNSKEITLEVTNKGDVDQILKKIRLNLDKSRSQFFLKTSITSDTILKPEGTLECVFECFGKYLGLSREICIFYFEDFTIAKPLEINVLASDEMNKLLNCNIDTVFKTTPKAKYVKYNFNAESVVYGPRPWKAPKFLTGERKGVYKVPEKLWDAVVGHPEHPRKKSESLKALHEYAPFLKEGLDISHYDQRFHTLLFLEQIELKKNFRQYDMQGVYLRHQGEYLVLEVPGLIEKRPSLIQGDKIILSQTWCEMSNVTQVGYIYEIRQKEIFVKFAESFQHIYDESECDIIFEPNINHLSRSHDAVTRAVKKLGPDWLFPSKVNEKPPQIIFEVNDFDEPEPINENVSAFISNVLKTQNDQNDPVVEEVLTTDKNPESFSPKKVLTVEDLEKNEINKKTLKWFNKSLNDRQKTAVINVLKGQGRPLPYIIFGPPGTGKTVTLIEIIMQIYHLIPESRILITTPSNSSADLVCERLIYWGNFKPGQLVRLLAYYRLLEGKIPEKLVPYSTVVDIGNDKKNTNNQGDEKVQMSSLNLSVGRQKITVGTCVCVGTLHYCGFPTGHFTHILVDEAGQATEPELLISATFQNIQKGQLVLIGDPQQLGPICISRLAEHFGFGISLLQRFVSTFPYIRDFNAFPEFSGYDPRFITRLNVNYRSVPEILSLPSQLFYDSDLIPTVSQTDGPEAEIIQKFNFEVEGRDKPPAIIFHGIRGQNYQESDSPSWYNPHEIWEAVTYLKKFYTIGLTCEDVGIITPYAKQVLKLRNLLKALDLSTPKIGTVEDFQGQERFVIIISTVRSSLNYIGKDIQHTLGFVANPRRLNVSLTRARALIIILGNPILLSTDPFWKNVVDYCVKNKSYTGCSLE